MLLCRYLAGMMLALVYRWFLMPDSLGHLLYTSQTARTAISNSQNSEEHISGKCLRSQISGLITISSSPNGLHLTLSRSVQKLSSARFRRGRRGGRACLLLPTFCRGAERKEKKKSSTRLIESIPWTGLDWTGRIPYLSTSVLNCSSSDGGICTHYRGGGGPAIANHKSSIGVYEVKNGTLIMLPVSRISSVS